MALVTVTDAARMAGVSRPTLYRRMESGKLSFTLDANKERRVDTAELLRVFGKLRDADTPTDVKENITDVTVDAGMVELLMEQLAHEREQSRRLLALLEQSQEQVRQLALPPGKSAWWMFWRR